LAPLQLLAFLLLLASPLLRRKPPFGVPAIAGIPTVAGVPFVSKIPAILLHKPSMAYTADGFPAVDGVLYITAQHTVQKLDEIPTYMSMP
jgi:hypothetical protein